MTAAMLSRRRRDAGFRANAVTARNHAVRRREDRRAVSQARARAAWPVTLGLDETAAVRPRSSSRSSRKSKRATTSCAPSSSRISNTLVKGNTGPAGAGRRKSSPRGPTTSTTSATDSASARWFTPATRCTRTPDLGPQQYDNNQWPGPGNNLYNTFDIDRAYLNFYFNPDARLDAAPHARCLQDLWHRDAYRQQSQLLGKQQPDRRLELSDQVRFDPIQQTSRLGRRRDQGNYVSRSARSRIRSFPGKSI